MAGRKPASTNSCRGIGRPNRFIDNHALQGRGAPLTIHRLMTLRFGAGATTRTISRELGISHSTVREYLARIAAAGITWPLPAELGDLELEQRLFVNGGVRGGA